MLKIIEHICEPVRFLVDWDVEDIDPGRIVQFTEIKGNTKVTISDGSRPFGVAGEMDPSGLIYVHFDTMIFRTDVYEPFRKYHSGDSLYVNDRGYLTNVKINEHSHLVGHVVSLFENGQIEINWI